MNFNPPKRGEPVAPGPDEGYVLEEEFVGRPYRIWAGPEEGTFVVQVTATRASSGSPCLGTHLRLQKQGSGRCSNRWTEPGYPIRWDYTMEERSDNAWRLRSMSRAYTSPYFSELSINYMTHWAVDVTSPDGTPRNKGLYELADVLPHGHVRDC